MITQVLETYYTQYVCTLFFLFMTSYLYYTKIYSKKEVTVKQEDYEDKYRKEVRNMEKIKLDDETLKNLINNFVLENTPMGLVIMNWNQEKKQFNYYSDRKDVPYKYLDTVARKYVKFFHCKDIYVDLISEILDTRKNLQSNKEKILKKMEEKKKDDLFLSNSKKIELKDEDLLIKNNVNSFKFMGKLRDYNFLQKTNINVSREKNISYSDFK